MPRTARSGRGRRAPGASAGGIRAYAAHRKKKGLDGGTPTAVEKALAGGRIERGKDGRIHFAAADRQWAARTDGKRKGPSAAAATNGKHADGTALLTISRAREAACSAELAELDLRRRKGELLEAAEVRRKLGALGALVKSRARSLSSRLTDVLSPQAKGRLEAEVDQMLEEFAAEADKL